MLAVVARPPDVTVSRWRKISYIHRPKSFRKPLSEIPHWFAATRYAVKRSSRHDKLQSRPGSLRALQVQQIPQKGRQGVGAKCLLRRYAWPRAGAKNMAWLGDSNVHANISTHNAKGPASDVAPQAWQVCANTGTKCVPAHECVCYLLA